jgi:addiction module HigA family antidote
MSQATRKPSTVGDIILYEYLEPSGLKINDLAEMLNVHRNSASALVNNNESCLPMAFRLAKAFDTTAKFWLNIQQSLIYGRLLVALDCKKK